MRKIILPLVLALAACKPNSSSDSAAENAIENITCPQSQGHLYDVVYKSLVDSEQVPTKDELQQSFVKAFKRNPQIQVNQEQFLSLASEFYGIVLSHPTKEPQELLQKVAALEIGDRTTDETKELQERLQRFQVKWDQYKAQQDASCSESPPAIVPPVPEPQGPSQSLVKGARKVLVTAYQSCAAGDLAPMTLKTPDVEGITRIGTHSDGVGARRAITNLEAVQRTDYYLQTHDVNSSCQSVRNSPLIYDYGGKPKTTSEDNSKLDLFTNAGSGTTVRGIDCSAFVFSAIATSGLKLHPDKKMKAILVHGVGSSMFLDPAENGITCFNKVKMGVSGTLKAGDIVAIPGHVFLIDSVSKDPFGLSRAKTVEQCADLVAENFDFVIAQSSPSKNGIGINRYRGADYLSEEPSIRRGFETYARQACVAKFQKKDVLMSVSNFQVTRHNQSSSCIDKAIALTGEACAQSCRL